MSGGHETEGPLSWIGRFDKPFEFPKLGVSESGIVGFGFVDIYRLPREPTV